VFLKLRGGGKVVYVPNGADDLSFAFFYIISSSELFYKQRKYSKEHNLDISCQSVVTEARFRGHASPCQICGRQNASSTRFSPSNSVSLWQYQTNWMILVLACDDIHWADWGFLCYEIARFITVMEKKQPFRCTLLRKKSVHVISVECMYLRFILILYSDVPIYSGQTFLGVFA